MGTVGVLTDSVACLSPELRSRLGIGMVGMYLILDGQTYRDSVDLSAPEFYARMGETISHKTAAPSVGEWLEAMHRAVDAGAQQLLVVTLAVTLSSTHDSARAAAAEMPVPTVVVDSKSAAAAEGLYVRRLAEEAASGATLDQLVQRAERRRGSYPFEFVIAGLRRLAYSGRMPSTLARLGDAVDLKPMLTLGPSGEVRLTGAVRGMDRGIERVYRRVVDVFPPGVRGRAVVTHALLDRDAELLAGRLRAERPELEVDVVVFSPVMGASTGPIIGIAWEDPAISAGAD
jgi:DegV family protein with EDD domain